MNKNWFLINFQDYNSYIMMLMTEFHDLAMLILLIILIFILYVIFWFLTNIYINKFILHNQMIEVIWTIIPIIILMFMALPSLKILYTIEEILNPYLTLKILGHQWYWSYEYSDFKNIDFDSFMINNYDQMNLFRLLDVDNRLVLPYNMNIRGLLSSLDVIHSWAMPSVGIKVDAIPGRMNQFLMYLNFMGMYFGQCSEICGLNHSFMPIVLESVNLKYFINWLKFNF
uniref:Cytochrome c oxidase subunit 2 n=1 Tax=Pseudognaptodon sp. QL-2014 TaxID=1491725 RepID=A0A0U1WH28_9HYME|nr:cytochrome c oxidase subunit II [Pseudognaptodon sp. QL-2014]